jgi:hypothetical protein
MKKLTYLTLFFILFVFFLSCNSTVKQTDNTSLVIENETQNQDFYLIFTIDGEEVNIPMDEISTTYRIPSKKPVFKIMAGEYGKFNLLLIIPSDVTKPSSTPSGSPNFDDEITQGSVSLQNYPEKNYTSNSYKMGTEQSNIISSNAIVITKSERIGDTHRIIEGTVNATVFGGEPGNDPSVKDRKIVGKFRVKHEFTDLKF